MIAAARLGRRLWVKTSREQGVTLLELIAALALASVVGLLSLLLFRQGRQTFVHTVKREVNYSQAAATSQLFSQAIRDGMGFREITQTSLVSVTRFGKLFTLEQQWGDSVVIINGKSPADSTCHLKIHAFGPGMSPDPMTSSRSKADTLDDNQDGIIDFNELDRDRNGTLDSLELPQVRLVELEWEACGQPFSRHRQLISPRNRVAPANAARDI